MPQNLKFPDSSESGRMAAAWRSLASALYFLDALSGALLIPVLPAVVGELLGVEKATPFATAWLLGVYVCCYFVGRSGTLGVAARVRSGSPRGAVAAAAAGAPSLLRISVLLLLSAVAYVACGVVVVVGDRQRQKYMSRLYVLVYFGLLRALAGCVAAGHRWFACRCLNHAARLEPVSPATEPEPFLGKSWNESAGGMGGLVAGVAFAGSLYQYSDRWPASADRPTLLLCLAAAAAHAPALISALHVAQRKCCSGGGSGGGGGGGAIDGGYSTVRGTPGGSDAEVELMGRSPWSAREDSFDSGRAATAGPTTPGAAAAHSSEGGEEISIPGRYLRGCAGDVVEAERRWRLTLEWRAQERVDEVCTRCLLRMQIAVLTRSARNRCSCYSSAF